MKWYFVIFWAACGLFVATSVQPLFHDWVAWASTESTTVSSKSKTEKVAPPAETVKTPPAVHPWKGSNVQLGGTMNTGNTDLLNFNSTVNLQYKKGSWDDAGRANYQYGTQDGALIAQVLSLNNQTNFYFNGKQQNFIFLKESYLQDWFSPYRYQASASTGYGRDLYKTDRVRWSVQAGPGYRFAQARNDPSEKEDSVILNTGTKLAWQITPNLSFSQDISNEYGSSYDYLHTVTELMSKLYGHLSLGLTFTVDYYSRIPPDSSFTVRTDTTTAVNLVYTF